MSSFAFPALLFFILGAAAAWFLTQKKIHSLLSQISALQIEKARLSERESAYENILAAEKSTIEKLQNEFKIAASDTLRNTSEQFLTTAIRDLRQVKTETDQSVDSQKKRNYRFRR